MATPNIVPRADSEGGIGTSSKYWASAYIDFVYVGAGKIGRDTDNYIDFSTDNEIQFRVNGNHELIFNANQIHPTSDDGIALGYAGRGFSDLFLASGAVINFDSGNVVLTHSNNHLTLADNDAIGFGNANDLKIYHDGSTTNYIQNQTGSLIIKNTVADNDIIFQADDGSGGVTSYLTLDGSANVITAHTHISYLDHKRAYFGTGFDLEIYHSGSNSIISHMGTGDLFIQNTQDDKDIIFQCDDGSGGNATYIRIDGSATITKFEKGARFNDTIRAEFGSSGDFTIQHDGSDSKIENATGDLRIRNFSDDRDIIFENDNGAGGSTTYFYLDGSSAQHDGSATTALFTNWPDKSRISLGSSHDLKIYHDSSSSYIENNTGNLNIMSRADDADIVFWCDDGSGGDAAYITLDGSSGYVDINRTMYLDDNIDLRIGTAGDLELSHDGNDSFITARNTDLKIQQLADDKNIIFFCDDGSGGTTAYFKLDGANVRTKFQKNVNLEDNVQLQIGNSQDLKLYHNASHSFISQEGVGNLYIQTLTDDGDIIFLSDDGSGSVEEYFRLDGSSGGADPFTVFPDDSTLVFGGGHDLRIFHEAGGTSKIENYVGNLTIQQRADDADIVFQCDDGSGGLAEYFRVDGSQTITTFSKNARVLDDVFLQIGSSADLYLVHSSGDSSIVNGVGDLYIKNGADNKDIIFQCDDGSGGVETYFFLDGSATSGSPVTIFPDNSLLYFGDGLDFSIGHNGSNSVMTNIVGNVFIDQQTDNGSVYFRCDDGSGGLTTYFQVDGASEILQVHKSLFALDNIKLRAGAAGDLSMYHDGTDSYIHNDTGDLNIQCDTDDGSINLKADNGSGGLTTYLKIWGQYEVVQGLKDIKVGDNVKFVAGDGVDLQIYHDGSNSEIRNANGHLKIRNFADDSDIIFETDDGSGGNTTYLQLDGSEVSTKILTQKVIMSNLPTSDPGNSGQLWNDNGTLKISVG